MAGMTPWVRQYRLRDLLDDSFALFRERVASLLLAGVVPAVLVVAFVAMMLRQMPGNFQAELSEEAAREMLESAEFWYFIIAYSVVSWVAFSFAGIAQLRIAVGHALGIHRSFTDALKLMAKPFWSLLVAGIIFGIITVVAGIVIVIACMVVFWIFIALGMAVGEQPGAIVGGVIGALAALTAASLAFTLVATFFVFTPVALAQEHLGPFAAIGRSFRLASSQFKTYFWALFAYMQIPLLFLPLNIWIIWLATFLGRGVEASLSFNLFSTIVSVLTGIVFMAMLACLQALMYIDGRCRVGGFDLVMLAHTLGLGEPVEQALLQAAYQPAATAYPNYAAPPVATTSAVTGLSQPAPVAGYPDYSAPPPVVTVPDYSAPPPVVTIPDDTAAPPAEAAPAPPLREQEDADAR
jgi:hypothetical protein